MDVDKVESGRGVKMGGVNLQLLEWFFDDKSYTPEFTNGWRAPKWWALGKVAPALNIAF